MEITHMSTSENHTTVPVTLPHDSKIPVRGIPNTSASVDPTDPAGGDHAIDEGVAPVTDAALADAGEDAIDPTDTMDEEDGGEKVEVIDLVTTNGRERRLICDFTNGCKFGADFAVFTRGAKVTRIPIAKIYAWGLSFSRAKWVDRRSNPEAVRIMGHDDPRLKDGARERAYYAWLRQTGDRMTPRRAATGSILDGFGWLSVKSENPMYRAGARLRDMIARFKEGIAEIDKIAETLTADEDNRAISELMDAFDLKIDPLVEAVR